MNGTTVRETRLRSLMHRIARAREVAGRQTVERETAIRRYGLAHPRTLAATHRLTQTRHAHRVLLRMYRSSASEHERITAHERS